MLDMIEHWVDMHPFLSCCLFGFIVGVMNEIDPFVYVLGIKPRPSKDEPSTK